MAGKKKSGYYVKGQFVAHGSELDQELQNATGEPSKTELKRASAEMQSLGEALLTLSPARLEALDLPESLLIALEEVRKITAFEGRRRQMQYIGKLMRQVDPEPVRAALEAQHSGSAQETLQLHRLEEWRERLIASDGALGEWMQAHPQTDTQQLRALIRQACKDAQPHKPGEAPRHGKAYRELFQFLREQMVDGQA